MIYTILIVPLSILLVHTFVTNSLWKGSTILVQCQIRYRTSELCNYDYYENHVVNQQLQKLPYITLFSRVTDHAYICVVTHKVSSAHQNLYN